MAFFNLCQTQNKIRIEKQNKLLKYAISGMVRIPGIGAINRPQPVVEISPNDVG